MGNRSIRDQIQGTLHVFGQSMGLVPKDPPDTPPAAPAPKAPAGTDLSLAGAANAGKNRTKTVDQAVDDAAQ